jgi:hypothetical protein
MQPTKSTLERQLREHEGLDGCRFDTMAGHHLFGDAGVTSAIT